MNIREDINNIISISLHLEDDICTYIKTNFGRYVKFQGLTFTDDIVGCLENILVNELSTDINNKILSTIIFNYKLVQNEVCYHMFKVDNIVMIKDEFISYLEDKYYYMQTLNKIKNVKLKVKQLKKYQLVLKSSDTK